jgi:two-component system phosphate regulon sensor histidine kinase PhoR
LRLSWPVQKIFQVNCAPVSEKGRVNGCLTVIRDITELKKLETMRQDFVANVSHELKTPLTSIMGFVETLQEGALDDKEHSRQFLAIIQEHARRLNSLVNDLLDLSLIETKAVDLDRKDLNLKTLVDGIVAGFKNQIQKKSLRIDNELPAGLSIRADKDRIEQVLTNLIDNAVKFNKEKGDIRIFSSEETDGLKITVDDTGIGIPRKDLPRIFERFYRVDKARSRELGGTGLGLSIVKHIVELHGGRAGVESSEGLGSQFWFILPR